MGVVGYGMVTDRYCHVCGSEIADDAQDYLVGSNWRLYCSPSCKTEDLDNER